MCVTRALADEAELICVHFQAFPSVYFTLMFHNTFHYFSISLCIYLTFFFSTFQLAIMAVISMTLFLRTKMHRDTADDGQIYMGALFFTVVMIMFNGMSELSMTIAKLPVFYKQRDLRFYPAWAYALPSWILKIPITFLEVGVWVFITYYVIGFDPNVGRYIIYCGIDMPFGKTEILFPSTSS